MWRLRLSALVERDIEDILEHSELHFGEIARIRYEAPREATLNAIVTDPDGPVVRRRDELGPGVRTYHIFYARGPARTSHGVVKRPRHLVVFRISGRDTIDTGRVLHDEMDMADYLPTEYREPLKR